VDHPQVPSTRGKVLTACDEKLRVRAPAHREHRFQGIVNTDSAAS